jgi:hypothetical protein
MKKILLFTILSLSFLGCDNSEEAGNTSVQPINEIKGVEIYNSQKIIRVGDLVAFKLLLIYADGTKAEQKERVSWSSTDESIVKLSLQGELTALKAGVCQVEAKYQKFSTTMQISIEDKTNNLKIKISEVLYDATGTDAGNEYVEIYNSSETEVNIAGYKLVDGDLKSKDFVFAGGTLLPAKSFLVVAQKQDIFLQSYNITNLVGDFTFSLNNSGETIFLKNSNNEIIDALYIEGGAKDYLADLAWGSTGVCKTKSGMSLQRDLTVADSDTELDWYEGEVSPGI